MNNKKLPKRKQLRLKNFDYSQNNAFFITICIHNRNRLLGEVKETSVGATLCGRPNYPHKMIEKWLFEIQNKYLNTKIDYYVIMPDHIHFILFIEGDHTGSPLQDIIGWFKTMTTNDYIKGVKNKLYEPFNKHFWQRDYFEHVIRNENDLFECRKYIEQNLLKWIIDKK